MPCHYVKLPGGGFAIVTAARGRQKRCIVCRGPGARLCDWKLGGGRTCSRALCNACSFQPSPEKDLCPEHRAAYERWREARARREP